MSERIEIANNSWEADTGAGVARRLEEFKMGVSTDHLKAFGLFEPFVTLRSQHARFTCRARSSHDPRPRDTPEIKWISLLANGDVNTQTPKHSAHTRTSDRERGSGNPRFRAFATPTHATHP